LEKLITFKDIENARMVLGIAEVANMEDIKSKFRKLILKYRPDLHQNSNEKKNI